MPGTSPGITVRRALTIFLQAAVAEHIDHALPDRGIGGLDLGVATPSATISARMVPPWATATVSVVTELNQARIRSVTLA